MAQVLAQAFSSGGTASAAATAVAAAYGKNKGGVSQALAQALVQTNSDGGKSQVAAQAAAEVRSPNSQLCTDRSCNDCIGETSCPGSLVARERHLILCPVSRRG
jgi:hypothetical protein